MFKTVIAYKYNNAETDFSQIQEQIKNTDYIFTPCDQIKTISSGFCPFYDDLFIIESDNRILLKTVFSSKNVSDKTVKTLLDAKIEEIKKNENIETVSDDVFYMYQDQIQRECLKYATIVSKTVLLLIDKNTHYIYVDATSVSLAEDALHLLRKIVGKLVCRYLSAKSATESLSRLIQFSNPDFLQTNIRVMSHPSVIAHNEDDVKISLSGLDKDTDLFMDVLYDQKIQSLELELVNPATGSVARLAQFVLYIGKNDILIIKKFSFDEPDDSLSDAHIDDDTYRYTSKMLLVGRYMKSIVESLHQILKIDNYDNYEK